MGLHVFIEGVGFPKRTVVGAESAEIVFQGPEPGVVFLDTDFRVFRGAVFSYFSYG